MAEIGQLIDGKYEILTLIGKGGMSRVYLARDQRLNKQWAVKEIQKNARDENDEVVSQSAIAEANMIKSLDHPYIVRITDIIEYEDVIYIVEDFVEGQTLGEILAEQGPQPQERVIRWAIQLCEAFEYLHTREHPIIYRDMKPANVMLRQEGDNWENDKIKIIDFGIARTYKEDNIEDTKSLGTRGYAAPEQFGGQGQTDARTDIYCLGKTLYHLLTGKFPYDNMDPIRSWDPTLDPGLEAIIEKCIQTKPEDRFQTCTELLYAFKHYNEYGEAYRSMQKKKLKKFIATSATAVVCFLGGIICLTARSNLNRADYEQNMIQAEKAATAEERIEYYSQAIQIRPTEIEPYNGMIEAMKDDAVFTTDESKILTEQLTGHYEQLKEQDGYGELAFNIGKLYWYYYDYGKSEISDNQITRMKSAIQWFQDAEGFLDKSSSSYQMSKVYEEIGVFNREITTDVQEATDEGKYKEYWGNMKELLEYIDEQDEPNEFVRLEVYKLSYSAIETYAKKFKADGIEESDMLKVYQSVTADINGMNTTSDTTGDIKNNLKNRVSAVESAITNAYREQGGENE